MITVGTRVRFIDDGMEGTVTSVIGPYFVVDWDDGECGSFSFEDAEEGPIQVCE